MVHRALLCSLLPWLLTACASNVQDRTTDQCTYASDLDAEEAKFVTLINSYRAAQGRTALAACPALGRAAQAHSDDMRDRDYFLNQNPEGLQPWDRACAACFTNGCGPATAMAENIGAGHATAQDTFTQWKSSEAHNANMLRASFTLLGVGRAIGGASYGVYWTTVFAAAGDCE